MVKFYFHFLLGIPNIQFGTGQSVVTADGGKELADAADVAEIKNYEQYKADKPTFACHIEYNLAPGVQPKSVDILCWGRVAKIYVEEESAAIIPLALDKICWIYFRVKHVTTINNDNVNSYYNHNIVIRASLDGKTLGQSAKSEKIKIFYGLRNEKIRLFPSLWEDLEDIKSEMNRSPVLSTNFEAHELSNKLKKVLQELTEEFNGKSDEKSSATNRMGTPWKIEQDKTAGSTQKDNGKAMISKNTSDPQSEISFVISGEYIFSGLKIFENCMKYKSDELPYFLSVVRVKDVLDPKLAKQYNPLSITLKSLNFVPVSALEEESVRKVRFCYVVCDKHEIQSNDIEISENMILNYTRTILTDRISAPELIEFIQTKGLKIILLGIREKEENGKKKVKPEMYKDHRINSKSGLPGISPKNKLFNATDTVTLGIANIDISSVLLEPHRLSVKYNFSFGEFTPQKSPKVEFCSMINPVEVNAGHKLPNSCHVLTSSPAILTVSVRLSYSVLKHFQVVQPFFRSRSRIFVVMRDVNIAANLLKKIQMQNELLAPTDYSKSATQINRPISIYNNEPIQRDSELNMLMMTGFLIDCVDYFLLYAEGPNFGTLQEIWSTASFIQPSTGRVLYDSSLLFNHTSHKELIRYCGFYVISLRQAPAILLGNKNSYKKGNIPPPAYKGLMQLYFLSRCSSITTAIQHNLFPDYTSLLSLDLEFGIPHMFIQSLS